MDQQRRLGGSRRKQPRCAPGGGLSSCSDASQQLSCVGEVTGHWLVCNCSGSDDNSTSANQSQTFGSTTAAQERANASSSSRPWANSLSSAGQGAPDSSMPAAQAQAVGSIPAAQRGDSSGRDSWTQSSSPGPLVQGNSSDSTCPSQVASASTPSATRHCLVACLRGKVLWA